MSKKNKEAGQKVRSSFLFSRVSAVGGMIRPLCAQNILGKPGDGQLAETGKEFRRIRLRVRIKNNLPFVQNQESA